MDINNLEQEIIKLSRKHNITQAEVRKIWNYQFKQIMKFAKDSGDEGCDIKVRGFGTIKFLPFKLKKIKEQINKKYEREILSESTPENGDRNQPD